MLPGRLLRFAGRAELHFLLGSFEFVSALVGLLYGQDFNKPVNKATKGSQPRHGGCHNKYASEGKEEWKVDHFRESSGRYRVHPQWEDESPVERIVGKLKSLVPVPPDSQNH